MGENRNSYRILVVKLFGRIPLLRQGKSRVDNIKTVLREIGCGNS
jgi:hypothetical protein